MALRKRIDLKNHFLMINKACETATEIRRSTASKWHLDSSIEDCLHKKEEDQDFPFITPITLNLLKKNDWDVKLLFEKMANQMVNPETNDYYPSVEQRHLIAFDLKCGELSTQLVKDGLQRVKCYENSLITQPQRLPNIGS